MSRKANPALIGTFVLGALILGIIAVLLLAGGEWFQKRSRHMLFFEEAAQGLQEGAPVVFLGVRIGTVRKIELGLAEGDQGFLVPVTVEIEPVVVQSSAGESVDLQERATIRKLVDRGMRARLKMQNLLTGQMYIDLDFYPDKPARMVSSDPAISEIPTIPTSLKELAAILDEFPVEAFFADLVAISSSTRKILSSEEVGKMPVQLEAILINLRSLTEQLDRESGPFLSEAKNELAELQRAIADVQKAMRKVGSAADRVGLWADKNSEIHTSITQAGEELSAAAMTLRQLADDQSPAVQRFNMSLLEISRAARAVRELADTLEQQPESLIRGKNEEGE